mgnify:FL=1|jgi:hypothetical protein
MLIKVQLTASGTATITNGDTLTPLRAITLEDARHQVTDHLTKLAREQGGPVITHLVDPDGEYNLCFSPDGNVTMATSDQVENALNPPKLPEATPVVSSPEPEPTLEEPVPEQVDLPEVIEPTTKPEPERSMPAPSQDPEPEPEPEPEQVQIQTSQPVQTPPVFTAPQPQNTPQPLAAQNLPAATPSPMPVAPAQPAQPQYAPTPAPVLDQTPQLPEQNQQFYPDAALNQPQPTANLAPSSFLTQSAASGPKPTGWRAVAGRLGLKVQASQSQSQQWADERTVSQHWPGPRTIAVLNGKGGAGKTPTSILLASYFARLGSGSVVAADGNVTRGTLGWRTEQGPHNATILDMVPQTEALMDPSARNGDVAAFTHHQTIDQFDVLRSNPLLLSTEQKLSPEELDGIQQVLTRYYRMIIWDTGNDEGDSLWLRIVSHADQIVIATTTRTDHAEAGRLLLQGLSGRDERSAALAANAVVVISQADREEPPATSLVDGFAGIAREVVTIPYDRSMREQWLRSDKLAPATRAAWLHAAAAVARGL